MSETPPRTSEPDEFQHLAQALDDPEYVEPVPDIIFPHFFGDPDEEPAPSEASDAPSEANREYRLQPANIDPEQSPFVRGLRAVARTQAQTPTDMPRGQDSRRHNPTENLQQAAAMLQQYADPNTSAASSSAPTTSGNTTAPTSTQAGAQATTGGATGAASSGTPSPTPPPPPASSSASAPSSTLPNNRPLGPIPPIPPALAQSVFNSTQTTTQSMANVLNIINQQNAQHAPNSSQQQQQPTVTLPTTMTAAPAPPQAQTPMGYAYPPPMHPGMPFTMPYMPYAVPLQPSQQPPQMHQQQTTYSMNILHPTAQPTATPPNKKPSVHQLYILDTPIPPLPPFEFDNLINMKVAKITRLNDKVTKLKGHHDMYTVITNAVIGFEKLTPPHMRNPDLSTTIASQRLQLANIFTQAEKLTNEINEIVNIQKASRPRLTMPENHPHNLFFNENQMMTFLKDACPLKTTDPGYLEAQWSRCVTYANTHRISHEQFISVFRFCVTQEQYIFIQELLDEDVKPTLSQIAEALADRYVQTDQLNDAHHELENFTREKDENIRSVKTRLERLVRKAIVLYPPNQRPGITATTLSNKLKEVIHPKTRDLVNRKEREYREAGLTLPIQTLIETIEDEERRHGKPKNPVTIPVSLYNTETDAEPDADHDALDDLAQHVEELEKLTLEATECNAAVTRSKSRNVNFANKGQNAMHKIQSSIDRMKKYRSNSETLTFKPSTFIKPPRPPTPGPSPNLESQSTIAQYTPLPMDTEETQPTERPSRSRDPAPNANSQHRSESERRRQEYRRRSATYDKYLHDRSLSRDPASRARALTPTSYHDRQKYAKLQAEVKRLQEERDKLKTEIDSMPRRYSSSPRDEDAGQRSRSQSRGRYGYGQPNQNGNQNGTYVKAYYRNNSNSSKKLPYNIHAYDGSTVNLNICNKCGITGEHTPQMCNTILAIRQHDQTQTETSEN